MRTRHLLIAAITVVAGAATAPAQAEGPIVPVPKTATKLTVGIVNNVTWHRAQAERADETKWPDGARVTVEHCKLQDRRHGSCKYTLDNFNDDGSQRICRRRVIVRIAKTTHRVSSRVRDLGCETI